jgi:hypothetical protein
MGRVVVTAVLPSVGRSSNCEQVYVERVFAVNQNTGSMSTAKGTDV